MSISPLKDSSSVGPKSIYDVIHQIDNQKDYNDFVLSHEGNPGAVAKEQVKYECHPVSESPFCFPKDVLNTNILVKTLASSSGAVVPASQSNNQQSSTNLPQSFSQQRLASPQGSPQLGSTLPTDHKLPLPPPQETESYNAPPPFQPPYPVTAHEQAGGAAAAAAAPLPMAAQGSPRPGPPTGSMPHLPPIKPVFGLSLDELYARDGTAVPMIVYQCFQGIELFGLDMEGIYRLSGSANHISYLKSLFDNGKFTQKKHYGPNWLLI